MGQDRFLVNLDKRQHFLFLQHFEDFSNVGIHNHLSGCQFKVYTAAEYIDKLREKAEAKRKEEEEAAAEARARGWGGFAPRAAVYRRIAQRESALLTKLPVEAISICIGLADSLWDKACFALTCQDAWDIARHEIVKDLRPYGGWAGDRILCISSSTNLDDVPPNVFNDEELATMRDIQTGKWQRDPDDDQRPYRWADFMKARDFLDVSSIMPSRSPVGDIGNWLHVIARDERKAGRKRDCWLPYDQDGETWSGLVRERPYNIGADGTVLCNFTTYEYVRGDAYLAARKGRHSCSPIMRWGLGEILLLRIGWACNSDGWWECCLGTVPHGAWAGHRFDFDAEHRLPRDEEGEVLPPWEDVSEELIGELVACKNIGHPLELLGIYVDYYRH